MKAYPYLEPEDIDEALRYAAALAEAACCITADLDFPRLLALTGADGPGLVLFRGGNYSESEMRALLERVLQAVPREELPRSIVVVDHHRIAVGACRSDEDKPGSHGHGAPELL